MILYKKRSAKKSIVGRGENEPPNEEAHEILEKEPPLLVKWGSLFILVMLLLGGFFFKYPDVITSRVSFFIEESSNQRIKIQIQIPISSEFEIRAGQVIYIYLDNFPHKEFGQLNGRIESIKLISKQHNDFLYITEILLSRTLKKNDDSAVYVRNEIQGNAMIINARLSLFQRFINRLKNGYRNKQFILMIHYV